MVDQKELNHLRARNFAAGLTGPIREAIDNLEKELYAIYIQTEELKKLLVDKDRIISTLEAEIEFYNEDR